MSSHLYFGAVANTVQAVSRFALARSHHVCLCNCGHPEALSESRLVRVAMPWADPGSGRACGWMDHCAHATHCGMATASKVADGESVGPQWL